LAASPLIEEGMGMKRWHMLAIEGGLLAMLCAAVPQAVAAAGDRQPGTTAFSDDAASDPQLASEGDIVVTAQKRAERLSDVPMSITAASGDTLGKLGITSADDLGKLVTGFNYSKSAYGVPVYTLRGVGFYDYSLAAVPAVTIYVDEVPLPYSKMGAFASLDLDRVEILKGPQGTLYGQNSTGGAINYIAAKPEGDFGAGLNFSYGRFAATDISGYLTGSLTGNMSARLSASHQGGGAWQKSTSRFDKLGDRNVTSARLLLEWEPTPDLAILLNLNGGWDKSDTQAAQFQQITPLNPTNASIRANRPALFNFPRSPDRPRAADWDIGVPLERDDRQLQAAMTVRYDLSPDIEFTSISSYIDLRTASTLDGDGTPFVNILAEVDGAATSVFQELRLSGTSGIFDWIAGLNYGKHKVREDQTGSYPDDFLGILGITKNRNGGRQQTESKAVYVNGNIHVTSALTLEGGLRYTDESHDFAGCTRAAAAAAAAYYSNRYRGQVQVNDCVTTLPGGGWGLYSSAFKEGNISWRAGVKWSPGDDAMLYANVSRGYKGGSYPLTGASNYYQLRPILQETLLAYEAGFKTALLDRRLQLSGAVFHYDYSDKQIRGKAIQPETGAAVAALVAIPKARVTGAEFQATARPIDGLSLGIDTTYADSRIKGRWTNYDFYGALGEFGGEAIPYSAKWSVSARADYEFAAFAEWKGAIGTNLRHQSSSYAGLGEQIISRLPVFTTLDVRASIGTDDDRLSIAVWGRNVTNEYYWNNTIVILGAIARYAAPPAAYGVSINLRN
jgi:outer membrane receptor protein involved in Fe transport